MKRPELSFQLFLKKLQSLVQKKRGNDQGLEKVLQSANFDDMDRPGLAGDSISREDGVMDKQVRHPPEVRERAVRMVLEHQGEHESQWVAIGSRAGQGAGA